MQDHRKLGRELELFDTDPLIGAGLPYWLPAGAAIRHALEEYVYGPERQAGYQHVHSPVLGKRELYEISGHWDHYRDGMYPPMRIGAEQVVLRPSLCPHHALIFRSRGAQLPRAAAADRRTRRHVPGRAVRRARRPDQGAVDPAERRAHLLHPGPGRGRGGRVAGDDPPGVPGPGHRAGPVPAVAGQPGRPSTSAARRAGTGPPASSGRRWPSAGLPYDAEEGEAAFYGPKIDIQVADSCEREASLSTIQVDFYQPERFDLGYIGPDNARHRPVMVHRSVIGGLERLVAHLIETHGGAFPPWLAPVQLAVLPVSEGQIEAAAALVQEAIAAGLRAELSSPRARPPSGLESARRAPSPTWP